MTPPANQRTKLTDWLAPIVYFSNNWISLVGVVFVTTATVFWLFLLPTLLRGEASHPYIGILQFLLLPAVFIGGLALIPLGLWLRRRREKGRGTLPADFGPLTLSNVRLRRLLIFLFVATFANVIIAGQLSFSAVHYMETVSFCGQTCHTVMQPEFTAYQNSPHSRVECVKCHIGPGADWFVKSKLSGTWQVVAVTFNLFPRPIPVPVANLRPARETCEQCHWPQKFGADRLRIIPKYSDDETNTLKRSVLLMRIGGGHGPGIHGAHLGQGVRIRYRHADRQRQDIPWVESTHNGKSVVFQSKEAKPGADQLPLREMDCMDCHTRPSHSFELPERAVDQAMARGEIPATMPFVKKRSVEWLKGNYSSHAEAETAILAAFSKSYGDSPQAKSAASAVAGIYRRNVFPEMRINWGTYPNQIGHTDYPGCFRCHDDAHVSTEGKSITQDCNTCHQLLAMEEDQPKILSELGLAEVTSK